MRAFALITAAVAALSVAAPAQAVTTIISEDFESGFGAFTPTGQVGINSGQDYADCCGATGNAASLANHFASFGSGGQPSGTLTSFSFALVAGESYTVTFQMLSLGEDHDDLTVQFGPITFNVSTINNGNNLDQFFAVQQHSFIPKFDGVGTLSFFSEGLADADAVIDNILVTTTAAPTTDNGVPEPATWAMMLLGFGAMGVAMRRRKSARVIAASR